jgi:MFS family permease
MKSLGVLWLVVFIGILGFGLTTLPFPIVAEDLGASNFWKTFGGSGVFSLFQFLSAPLWGRLSDAYGRRVILIGSMAGSILAYVWLAYADSLASLIASRAFGGIMSGNIAAAYAYATDVSEAKDRARAMGIVTSAFGLGFAIGPLVGGWLGVRADGTTTLFEPSLLAAGLAVLALLGSIFLLKESLPRSARRPFGAPTAATAAAATSGAAGAGRRSPFGLLGTKPALLGLLIATFAFSIGGAAMQSVYPFWARDEFGYNVAQIGPHFFVLAVLSAAGQLSMVGPVVKRIGEKRTALVSALGCAASLVLLALAHGPLMLWSGLILFGLSLGVFTPAVTSLVSFEADPKSRGAVMGIYQAASSAGRILGPAVSGPVYFVIGTWAPFALSALLVVFGGAFLARLPRRPAAATPAQHGAAPGGPT